MKNCLFCKIIKGDIPSDKVFEDKFTYAFRDINPVSPIHILIIPKDHISGVNDLNISNYDIIAKLTSTAKKICKDEGIESQGYRWIINSGKDAGQSVFHLHLHILGGRKFGWPPG